MQASEPISSSSFRYMSENIQSSRMKNIILPQVSAHHQLYSYGYDDFFSDVPMQIDNAILNAYERSSFYMDTNLYTQQEQLDEAPAFCSEPFINTYQSGPSFPMTIIKSLDCPSLGASHLSINSPTLQPRDCDNTNKQEHLSHLQKLVPQKPKENAGTRERPIEKSNVIQKRSPEQKPSENEWTSNKKRAAVCCQEQLQDYHQIRKEIKEVQRGRVPVRRSQKLADKITALQKLVSPYGKTDTASVLYEASIFIKVLQDQIENICNTLSSSLDNKSNHHKNAREKEFHLRNKGFCLVPVSVTQDLIKEESAFNQHCS